MAQTKVTKVGQGSKAPGAGEKGEKKVSPPRVEFDIKAATNAGGARIKLDDAGRLTEVPANFEPKMHKPLGKKHFTTKSIFFDFRISQVDRTIGKLQERRESLVAQRAGKESNSRKVARMEKLKQQLAELEKELKESGVQM